MDAPTLMLWSSEDESWWKFSLRSRGNIQSSLINSRATLALVSPGMNVEKTLVQNCRSSTLIISLLKSHLSSVYNICLLKNPYPRFYTNIINATSARVSGCDKSRTWLTYILVLLCFQPSTTYRNSCYLRTYILMVPHDLSKPKIHETCLDWLD
jgi:hypothetical protein